MDGEIHKKMSQKRNFANLNTKICEHLILLFQSPKLMTEYCNEMNWARQFKILLRNVISCGFFTFSIFF